ncbi:diuretic hormone class 2 isoform X2 [Bemisia tabaci]|uniref:diuretic hormone class 2 isoform X2 n=2 Tax=Bemisia tabaci TaxID=7038 RepID=UPI0008F9B2F2|nr:PREDICTED: diuretic hormone class 2 isoform X2 [Bemisia tabaci]
MHLKVVSPSSLMAVTSGLLLGILILLTATQASESVPFSAGKSYMSEMEEPDTEMMLEMLARLGQSIIRANDLENSKRGLDLGLSRGFSGSQAAKHLMGLAAANYAGGPGRRRRASNILPNEI